MSTVTVLSVVAMFVGVAAALSCSVLQASSPVNLSLYVASPMTFIDCSVTGHVVLDTGWVPAGTPLALSFSA